MKILSLVTSLNYGGAKQQSVLDAHMLINAGTVYFGFFKDGDLHELLNERVKVVQLKSRVT